MQAYRIVEWQHEPQLVEVDVPTPGRGQVLVRVAGTGLCHSDVGMSQMPAEVGEAIGWHMPFTLGHEVGGTIATLGEGVTGYSVGDPVALVSPTSCGTCDFCLRGQDNNCEAGAAGRGYGRDGGLAEYVLVDSVRSLIPLNSLNPAHVGALTDAGATAYHAVRRVLPKLRPGSHAVVIGAGGLGSFAVQFLRALSPARVIAVDTNEARLNFALELGAHETLVGVGDTTQDDLIAMTGGGATAVLDFAGFDATITAGVGATKKGGSYGLVGAGGGSLQKPWYGGLPVDGEVFNFQGSTIADAQEVIRLAELGLIRNEVEEFALADVELAYAKLSSGTLRGRAIVIP